MSRLLNHLSAVEESLLAYANRLSQVSNTTIVGSARENFVREFLRCHLGSAIGIGSGEIISAFRPHDQTDRQHDIVIYDDRFPKLSLTTGINSFLIESVFCTIEIKTTLNKNEYQKSARNAAELKYRWRLQAESLKKKAPRQFVVAFSGPEKMSTVINWMSKEYAGNVSQSPQRPLKEMYFEGPGELSRAQNVSSSLDGIFILGKGFVLMDSFGFRFADAIDDIPKKIGESKGRQFYYAWAESKSSSIACLFLALMDIFGQTEILHEYMPSLDGNPINFQKMPNPSKV